MRAVLSRAPGPPESLTVEEVPSPSPGPGQVVVRVHAAGVNFPDTLIIQGKYQFKPDPPFTPGSELAGVVKEVGQGVKGIAPGDRVLAFSPHGAFAEEAAVDAQKVLPLPPSVPFEVGACLPMAYGTARHALVDRARLAPGQTLLVLGAAGGVGLAAVEVGVALGARVIAAASTEAKLQVCRQHGAAELVCYGREDWRDRVKELTGGRGAEAIYDPVGGALAEPAIRLTAWAGNYLVIGFAGGEIPRVPLNLPLLKGFSIAGVFWGEFARRRPEENRAHLEQLFRWVAEGRIRPRISATYPLERTPQALQAIRSREATGKLVILVGR